MKLIHIYVVLLQKNIKTMASIREFKKDVNYVLGDIIDAVLIWEITTDNQKSEKGTVLIEELLTTYDSYMLKINKRGIEQRGAHLKALNKSFQEDAAKLIEKVNNLS